MENPDFDDEVLENVVILTDENGEDTEFELLDLVEWNGKKYVILLPVENADEGVVVILRVETEGDDETYVGLESEEECSAVFEFWKQNAADNFDFVD